jgi:hypothetical protein
VDLRYRYALVRAGRKIRPRITNIMGENAARFVKGRFLEFNTNMTQADFSTANSTFQWTTALQKWAQPVDREAVLKRLELLARFLDDAIELPGIRYRIGWDGVIGLVPGVGDAISALLSGYLVWEAHRLGVSGGTMLKMIANIVIDMLVGAVPVLGDVLDFAWKANRRNLQLLREALAK